MSHRLLALLAASTLLLAACGKDDEGAATQGGGAATAPATEPAQTTETAGAAPAGCEAVQAPEPKPEGSLKAPSKPLGKGTWDVTLQTSCGEIQIRLDTKENPKTAASFAALVRRGFYDGLTFHRIGRLPDGGDFVIQGGDPTGQGNGGPGYSVTEAPPSDTRYTKGVVAMAKTATEAPGTSGSQFYIVTAEDSGLPPEYAVAGKVVGPLDAVEKIAKADADPQTERPTAPIVIQRASLAVPGSGGSTER
ncbi:peptidylprolyl isomerase [Conexibacter sp. SYSU D00693]|uniref:peptidylprolyl isomerase n=1 Tax=Conexibacter sp. SYSU D00693 TaxID=2812560 RepID=UPI00196B99E0|nr:peptidylprolyl isomerase [Conexibacter sp. SYSU D00693]